MSEKDIEKEHQVQLRRWKETHGDLHCKSPPRMHGAKAIMTAEPPSRQELKHRPTIIVKSPLVQAEDVEESKNKTNLLPEEIVNPYAPVTNLSPLPTQLTIRGSKESLSSTEHDTYL